MNGAVLNSEVVHALNYSLHVLDLREFKTGNYIVTVSADEKIVAQQISVK